MKRCIACDALFESQAWACEDCGFEPTHKGTYHSFISMSVAEENFEAAFFPLLRRLEPGFWWFEARNAVILWAMKKWGTTRGSFFEIGAGTGFVSSGVGRRFSELQITASELFPDGLPIIAERLPNAVLLQLDGRQLPFRAEFDMIGAFDVIEHIEQDVDVLVEMHKALKPRGVLLITVPQHQFLWSNGDVIAHHKRRYGRRDLTLKLQEAGFEISAMRSFVSLLLPLQLLVRLRRKGGPTDETAEFRIPPAINKALRALMHIELALIRLGVSFPVGGSLLVVARPINVGGDQGDVNPSVSRVNDVH